MQVKKYLIAFAIFNLAIVLLFPPFDDYSITNRGIAIFYGFVFILNGNERLQINQSMLYLEVMVILINFGIFWLLTNTGNRRRITMRIGLRNTSMIVIALNLIAILLFPPFEYVSSMTHAVIPTFDGFYFIFSHPRYQVIVTPILYIEVFLVLINGGLMLLLFKEKKTVGSAQEALHYLTQK